MLSASTSKYTSVLKSSDMFGIKEFVPFPIHAMNIAISANLNGGLFHGLHTLAGESRCFKTLFGLIMMKAYLDAHKDGIAIFFDSEFGAAEGYFSSLNIDTNRVLHVPVHNIEELTFEVVKKLDAIERGENVFLFVDSVGNLASKREVENARTENSAKDMSRPGAMKGFFRIVTPYLTTRQLPMVVIQHTYKEQGSMYPQDVVSGGQGGVLSSNTIWIMTKRQNKEDGELLGFDFTINVYKSRLVVEKSQIPVTVNFNGGVSKFSGLLDIAKDAGLIETASRKGWYKRILIDKKTGVILDDKEWTKKESNCDEFWEPLLADARFNDYVRKTYLVSDQKLIQ